MYDDKYGFLGAAEKAADIVILSILWLLCCIPAVTAVPAGAALYYTVVKYLRRGRGKLFQVFWGAFLQNMKQGIALSAAVCVYGIITLNWLAFAGQFEVTSAQGMIFTITSRVLLVFGLFSQVYLCPVLSRFRGSVKSILLGAVYMGYRYFFSSLCAAVLLAAALYTVYVLPVSAAAVPAVYMLLLSFPAERNMKKYMKGLEAEDADQWYLE